MKEIWVRIILYKERIMCLLFPKRQIEWKRIRQRGKEENKIFYCIRRKGDQAGLFSYILYVLEKIKVADDNGWYPVIDMQSQINSYLYPREVGKKNSWEYYYMQPDGMGVEDLKKCKNVIFSDISAKCIVGTDVFMDDVVLDIWHNLFKKYIHLNEETKYHIDNIYMELFGGGEQDIRCLGAWNRL